MVIWCNPKRNERSCTFVEKKNIDWGSIGFGYVQTDYRYVANYKNGAWDEGGLTTDANITMNESACVLQYAQTVFEGMKAYTFLEAIRQTVKANEAWVPPYGSGASLYLRPYMFGIDPIIGVKPATEFQFRVFGTPVGPYFKGGIKPLTIRVSDLDRAAPRGTGHIKAGLNYAMSLYNIVDAHEQGYDENLYVDSATRTHIEETGGANILFVTKEGKLVVPKSATILPSITRRSLIQVARDYLHLEVEERVVGIDELGDFAEAGLCGTAAVISPIGKIVDHGKEYTYAGMGNVVEKLYKTLTGIQMGTIEAPEGWIMVID